MKIYPAAPWQTVSIERIVDETPRVKTFTLGLSQPWTFLPGQHVKIRLTAPDGYQAQRDYSIASPPEIHGAIDLTIERVADGEVSEYLHDQARLGDTLELRGPIGGPFTWTGDMGGPFLGIAGGSGITPIMSMLRHRKLAAPDVRTALVYSTPTFEDIIYRDELLHDAANDPRFDLVLTLTREAPSSWTGLTGRVHEGVLRDILATLEEPPLAYVCGSSPFVSAMTAELVALGVQGERIRTERFGPSD